jgi:hypothetical protein
MCINSTDIWQMNQAFAFRLDFFSVAVQEKLAKELKKMLPNDTLMSIRLLTDVDKQIIDIDAVVDSLETSSIEEVVSKSVYYFEVCVSHNKFHLYVSPYFIFGNMENKEHSDILPEKFLEIFKKIMAFKESITPAALTCSLNFYAQLSREDIDKKFKPNVFPVIRENTLSNRYTDTYKTGDTLVDIVRTIRMAKDHDQNLINNKFDINLILNNVLYFNNFEDLMDSPLSEMFKASKEEIEKYYLINYV